MTFTSYNNSLILHQYINWFFYVKWNLILNPLINHKNFINRPREREIFMIMLVGPVRIKKSDPFFFHYLFFYILFI